MTAEDYLNRVAFELRDLPWRLRPDLLSDVRGHLAELPGTDLEARLGTPEKYATDLRSAAALERRRGLIAFVRARRPRNVVLVVVLLTLIGLAIGAAAWISSYQPLAPGFGSRYPAGAVEAPAGNSESVVFQEGRPFNFGSTVLNTGRFAVRVLGVPYPSGVPWSARLMRSPQLRNTGGMHGPYVPFHPFDLKRDHVVFLFFKGTFACRAPRPVGALGLDDFPVRYSFLGRTSTADIPLPVELAIVFRKKNSCR